MIYLLATSMLFVEDMHTEVILKIGYSDDSRGYQRFKDYESSGMTIKVLQVLQGGSYFLEGIIQDYFSKYSIPGRSKEWFYYRPEIIDFFDEHNSSSDIFRYLIDNYMLLDPDRPAFYLLPSFNEQLDIILDSLKSDNIVSGEVINVFENIKTLTTYPEKMEYFCRTFGGSINEKDAEDILFYIPAEFRTYYLILGPDRCKAHKYRNKDLSMEYLRLTNNQSRNETLVAAIYEKFEIGKPYRKSDMKDMVREVFDQVGVKEAPKASFLENYFNMKPVKITDKVTKKRDNGFEILSRKE